MDLILVLNCGSQTIKWKLFKSNFELEKKGEVRVKNQKIYQKILIQELNKIKDYQNQISTIGHRVVHGGEKFRAPIKITPLILKELKKYNKLAPLHNPFNLLGIKVAKKISPKASQFAVFDTGFFKDLPKKTYIYPLAENLRKKHNFRRFGFHGISHEYVAQIAAKKISRPIQKLKIITVHLGGGASITAIKGGVAVDTSMGFTPLEGLVMMTRSGDIDPGVVLELCKIYSPKKAENILNNFSGLKGVSGSGNMLEILERVNQGDDIAKLALDIFIYRIQKYIGAYFTILGGCDILVFTGVIGFGSKKIREMICKNLNILKSTKVMAIETDEELAIAKKIKKL